MAHQEYGPSVLLIAAAAALCLKAPSMALSNLLDLG